MNRVTIDFESAEDLLQFTRLAAKAKLEEGTPGSLWVALACSALKRAKVQPTPENGQAKLLEALKEIAERGPVPGYGSADALRLRLVATQSIARAAISETAPQAYPQGRYASKERGGV